ncbi:MAG: GDSL-type esterase/lipase family protein [Roseburia sp.]
MKKLLQCKVTIFLLAGWLVLSVAGFLGKDTIYKNYTTDVAKKPYFVLVLQGIHDGIYPWSAEPVDFWERWQQAQEESDSPDTGGEPDASGSMNAPGETEAADESAATENADGTEYAENAQNATEAAGDTGTEATEPVEETEEPKLREFVDVDESYFDDAVFIGDSRTVGLHDYSGLDQADFYATVGLNVYDMWDEAFCDLDGKKVTLEEALSAKQYGKVYFQIGINEMGRGTIDTFMEAYSQSVQRFRELQPDAIIYVQAIMKVTKSKSDNDAIFNNEGITARNERIAQLADSQTIFYIDVNEVVCDESGGLNPELTFDNLHLYGSKYDVWVDFLKTKGVE